MTDTRMPTFTYDVTEGGVLVRYGAEDGLDLTSPSDNPLIQLQNIHRVTALLEAPWRHAEEILGVDMAEHQLGLLYQVSQHAPVILKELAELAAEIGEPCGVCGGDGGQEITSGTIGWVDCSACDGNRVQVVAA